MNNAELIKGIERAIEGLELIKKCLSENTEEVSETVKEEKKPTAKAKKNVMPKPVEEEEEVASAESEEVTLNRAELDNMKYNEFKKLASNLGVKCTGTRDEIMERIEALPNVTIVDGEEAEDEDTEDEDEEKVVPISKGKKLGKKKEEEPTEDEFDVQAKEVAEETDVEDIIEALADVGVKATKKNAVEKLAQALRDGLISLDDEDEEDSEEESEADTTEEADEEEITADGYYEEYDPQGFNDPSTMTKARAKAVKSLIGGVIEQIESEQIGEDDILAYLEDNCTDEEKDLLGDEYTDNELIKFYIEMLKRTVDDEGETHEQSDPYELNGEDVCCGHTLSYSKKTKKYICEICGEEYEAE